MSTKKSKNELTSEERVERDAQAMENARKMRERRRAVQGEPAIDRDVHLSLPLTRVFMPLIVLSLIMYCVARFAIATNNSMLLRVASTAAVLLFLTAFAVWFISRHQAKKLTEEVRDRREDSKNPKDKA